MIWSAKNGVTDLGLINGQNTFGEDINNNLQICGRVWTNQLNPLSFYWSSGKYTVFGPVPGGSNCFPGGLNNLGDIVAGGNTNVGYIWNGDFQPLPPLNAEFNDCGALAINDSRRAPGKCRNNATPLVSKLVLWVNSVPRDLSQMIIPVAGLSLDSVNDYVNDISAGWTILGNGHLNAHNVAVVLKPQMPIMGDTDCDAIVNVDDLLNVISGWGPCLGCNQDLNGDQTVNIDDLLLVITNWTLAR